MSFKNKALTESDLKIIENHSKKNLADTINELDNVNAACSINEPSEKTKHDAADKT